MRTPRSIVLPACRGESGFALVVVLTLLAFVVLVLTTLAALTRVEVVSVANQRELRSARSTAEAALQVAIGRLQATAGPDARVTTTAESFAPNAGAAFYTAVWDAAAPGTPPLTWLVSGNEQLPAAITPAIDTTEFVELLGAGTGPGARAVVAPLQEIWLPAADEGGGPRLVARFAWWVEDLGVKASLGLADRSDEVAYPPWDDETQRSRLRQQVGGTPTWLEPASATARGFDPLNAANRERLSRFQAPAQLQFVPAPISAALRSDLRARHHDFTHATHGVLANTLPATHPSRGLLRDLSLAPDQLGPAFAVYASRSYVEPPAAGNSAYPPITGTDSPRRRAFVRAPIVQPEADTQPAFIASVAPVLTEFLLQFRVDRVGGNVQLRSRLYVGLWNPYTCALVPPDDLNLVVGGLPTITITDPDSAASASVDLQVAPFGPWGERVELPFTPSGGQTDRVSWLPGRMYSWVPVKGENPSALLEFYEKNLSVTGWVVDTVPLAGTSRNLAVSGPPVTGLTVQLRLGNEVLATIEAPAFPAFEVADVEPAGPTTQYNWRFAYGFRLNQPSSTSTNRSWLVSAGRDPRRRTVAAAALDPFSLSAGLNPAAVPEYIGTPRTATGFDHLLIYREQGTDLDARSANYDTPVFELPRQPLLSLGELQHLQIEGKRPFSVGNSWGGAANDVFDRYFLSGLAATGPGPDVASGQPLPNWSLVPVDTRSDRSAPFDFGVLRAGLSTTEGLSSRFLLQRGAFNVNSVRTEAWRAVLASVRFSAALPFRCADIDNGPTITRATGSQRTVDATVEHLLRDPAWAPESGGPAFFRFPQTAQETYFVSTSPLLEAHELSRRAFRQGVRGGDGHSWSRLSAQQVSDLAGAVVALVRAKQVTSGPFRTLSEFLGAAPEFGGMSLLERAIEDAGLNPPALAPAALSATEDDPGFSSLTLTQADILTALAPYLRVRSDTFAIRVYGESLNPATGQVTARAWAEAIAQRGPAPLDPTDSIVAPDRSYGRAFTISSFRWLTPSEL